MRQVLIIDENPPFREYLKAKLSENNINAVTAMGSLDGIAKLRTEIPDLIILDYHLSRQGCLEVLQAKKTNANAVNKPVIVMAQNIDQKKIVDLLPYNVKKVFTKPVKIDALLSTLSEILSVPLTIDQSPGTIEVHSNENILFIEVAQGLNRDKIEMLKFKIMELIELNSIKVPKFILMFRDMSQNTFDVENFERLLSIIIQTSNQKPKNIRVLTMDSFIKESIVRNKKYNEIDVVSNLQYAMDGLLADVADSLEDAKEMAVSIVDKVFSGAGSTEGEALQLRFEAETKKKNLDAETIKEFIQEIYIAAVDDDSVTLATLKKFIQNVGGNIETYNSGGAFLEVVDNDNFDIIFLDLLMPGIDGFTVLDKLRERNIRTPVIVISSITGRETVLRVFRQGIKSYITKPIKSEEIIRKLIEILKPSI